MSLGLGGIVGVVAVLVVLSVIIFVIFKYNGREYLFPFLVGFSPKSSLTPKTKGNTGTRRRSTYQTNERWPSSVSSSGGYRGGYTSVGGAGGHQQNSYLAPATDTSGMKANIQQAQAGYVADGVPSYQVPYSSYNPGNAY